MSTPETPTPTRAAAVQPRDVGVEGEGEVGQPCVSSLAPAGIYIVEGVAVVREQTGFGEARCRGGRWARGEGSMRI